MRAARSVTLGLKRMASAARAGRVENGGPEGGPNAGAGVAPGPAVAAWHRGRIATGGGEARARRPAAADPGTDGPTPIRKGETPFSSLLLLSSSGNFSRRPSPPTDSLGAEAAALEARTPTDPATRALALTSAPRSPHDASLRAAGGLFRDAGPSFVRPSRHFPPQPPQLVPRMDASFLSHKISVYRTSTIRDLTDPKPGWSWLWFRGVVPEPFVSVLR